MSHFFRTTLRSPFPALWASLAVFCLLAIIGGSAHGASLLWYGGDAILSSGFFNNTRVTANFGDSILDDFVVSDATGWHVTSLFSNNLADFPIDIAPFTQAVWSIRIGVSAGAPGDILFAGISPVTVTPTGRTFGGDTEYTVTVSGLSLDLVPGVYFMNVSPVTTPQIYYVGNSDGTNAVGRAGPSGLLQEEIFIVDGARQHTIREFSTPRASMGVIGFVAGPVNVNSELSGRVKPDTSTFNPQPVSDGPAGTFSFMAEFCNIADQRLIFLKTVTAVLTGGSILLNRDSGTPSGVGSELTFAANRDYVDLTLDGGECVDVPYVIGLARRAPFEFVVDVLGILSDESSPLQQPMSRLKK